MSERTLGFRRLLTERGVTVAANTSSNLRIRSGIAPVARFIDTGLRFGLGLDGGAHDDDQDYFRDLRIESDDEVDVLLTRATSAHVRHLVVDGRDVVRDTT